MSGDVVALLYRHPSATKIFDDELRIALSRGPYPPGGVRPGLPWTVPFQLVPLVPYGARWNCPADAYERITPVCTSGVPNPTARTSCASGQVNAGWFRSVSNRSRRSACVGPVLNSMPIILATGDIQSETPQISGQLELRNDGLVFH